VLEGRASMDLFNPQTLKTAGLHLGGGAAVGAAIGIVADLAVGGASLGAGAALGGALGGALAQGWGPFGRRVLGRLRGVHELSVEEAALYVMAQSQLALVLALERRGHGALAAPVDVAGAEAAPPAALADAVHATRPARAHAEWARNASLRERWTGSSASGERQAVLDEVARALGAAAQALDTQAS